MKLYKYQYLDKLDPDYQSGDMAFGSALHSAVNAALTKEDALAVFNIYWDSYKDKKLVYGRNDWEALLPIGQKLAQNFQRLHAPKYQLKFAEQRVRGEYKGVILEGTPDFLGEYNGRYSLRDFKTSGVNYDKHKADIALQLNLYAYLCSTDHGLPQTLGYTVFNKGTGTIQDLTWDFSQKLMLEMLDNMVEQCKIIDKGGSYPKNYNHCLDFNRKCAYWSKCHGDKND